jgi:hypothetical protein
MTSLRVVPHGASSYLFSGPSTVVKSASLAELISHPDVVWWPRGALENTPILAVRNSVYLPAWNTGNDVHLLIHIEVPTQLQGTLDRLFQDGIAGPSVMALILGNASELQGSTVNFYKDASFNFDGEVGVLLDKSEDCRLVGNRLT